MHRFGHRVHTSRKDLWRSWGYPGADVGKDCGLSEQHVQRLWVGEELGTIEEVRPLLQERSEGGRERVI